MIEYIERKGSNCYKWDSDHAKGMLPLWVADMDFKCAPSIIRALEKRISHGAFGYEQVPQEYYQSIANWFEQYHGWSGISSEKIIYTIGVVPAISAILRAITTKGDKVLTLTPAYNCFFSSISNLECSLLASELINKNNHFEIDWLDLEQKMQEAKVFILCNPHNPTGRIWTKQELEQIASLANKHGVFVVSDEIHCEFAFGGYRYIPYSTVSCNENYAICISASKAFNIAGLQCANIFVPNKDNYELINRAINIHEVCDVNPFGVEAMMAAYTKEGKQWIDELNEYVYKNYAFIDNYISSELPMLHLTKIEGTYLAWIDIREILNNTLISSSEDFCCKLAQEEKVLFNPSEMYGADGYIRVNMATSIENIELAMQGLKHFIESVL